MMTKGIWVALLCVGCPLSSPVFIRGGAIVLLSSTCRKMILLLVLLATMTGCSRNAATSGDSRPVTDNPEQQRLAKVIADATEAIQKNPKECDARGESVFHKRGKAHVEKNENDKAVADLSEAIRLYLTKTTPYWPARLVEAFDARAKCFERKKDHEKAIADYSEVIRMGKGGFSDLGMAMVFSGSAANAYYRRGLLHDARGDHEQAMSDYKAAARLGPELLETNPDLKKRLGEQKP